MIALSPEAEAQLDALMAGRRVIVPGFGNKIGALVLPMIPDVLLLPLVHGNQSARTQG